MGFRRSCLSVALRGPALTAAPPGNAVLELARSGNQLGFDLHQRLRQKPPQEPLQVRADHPFLFLIRDNASGMILFLGRVSDPGGR